jgi:hypothetical protein
MQNKITDATYQKQPNTRDTLKLADKKRKTGEDGPDLFFFEKTLRRIRVPESASVFFQKKQVGAEMLDTHIFIVFNCFIVFVNFC